MTEKNYGSELAVLPEYDINISEITLIHRFEYLPHTSYVGYETGRMSYGLVHVLSGSAEYINLQSGENITAKTNTTLFLPADSRYRVENRKEVSFTHYTVNFSLIPDAEKNGILGDYFSSGKILSVESGSPAYFKTMFEKLLVIWAEKRSGFHLEAKAQLYLLAAEFFSEFAASKVNKNDYARILPVKQYIDANFSKAITLADLSELCGISNTHMRRIFSGIFHMSPIEYQINLRILHAKDLLLTGLYTVGETAELCGFSDPNYFSRIFKEYVGISPMKYQKNH